MATPQVNFHDEQFRIRRLFDKKAIKHNISGQHPDNYSMAKVGQDLSRMMAKTFIDDVSLKTLLVDDLLAASERLDYASFKEDCFGHESLLSDDVIKQLILAWLIQYETGGQAAATFGDFFTQFQNQMNDVKLALIGGDTLKKIEEGLDAWLILQFGKTDICSALFEKHLVDEVSSRDTSAWEAINRSLKHLLFQGGLLYTLQGRIKEIAGQLQPQVKLYGHNKWTNGGTGFESKIKIITTTSGFFIEEHIRFTGDAMYESNPIEDRENVPGLLNNVERDELLSGVCRFHVRYNPVERKVEYKNTDLVLRFKNKRLQNFIIDRSFVEHIKDFGKEIFSINGLSNTNEIAQTSAREIQQLKQERALALRPKVYVFPSYPGSFFSLTMPVRYLDDATHKMLSPVSVVKK